MSENYVKINNLSVSDKIFNFINNEALPDLHIKKDHFWKNFDKAAHELASKNKELLNVCLLYTSPSPRDISGSRMPSSA